MRKTSMIRTVTLAALAGAGISTAVMAQDAPPPPAEDEAGMFALMDTDKDGKVTQAEIDAFKAARFAEADTDKDGKLSPAELLVMREKAETARREAMAKAMVARIDTDKDGLVSAAELAAAGPGKGMIDRLDSDGDGAVSLAEMEAAKDHMKGHGKHGKRGHDGEGRGDGPRGGWLGWWWN
ncbi:EF-hand domain-containing protein [Tabrizicola fusiformis]|uniref:EF-hand domain-containing protein n=1 Tax=Tabrizicola sp. SY72 TaxID=2741673 RepID=UPI001F510FCF|nr:EF-hand domain-containing protein [Tabrizicola sp. SY72]